MAQYGQNINHQQSILIGVSGWFNCQQRNAKILNAISMTTARGTVEKLLWKVFIASGTLVVQRTRPRVIATVIDVRIAKTRITTVITIVRMIATTHRTTSLPS